MKNHKGTHINDVMSNNNQYKDNKNFTNKKSCKDHDNDYECKCNCKDCCYTNKSTNCNLNEGKCCDCKDCRCNEECE